MRSWFTGKRDITNVIANVNYGVYPSTTEKRITFSTSTPYSFSLLPSTHLYSMLAVIFRSGANPPIKRMSISL